MTTADKAPLTPRTIVSLGVGLITDDAVAELSDAAFRLLVTAITKSAQDGTNGVVRVGKPAIAQRWATLEGGTDALKDATEELLAAGLFVRDDTGTTRVRSWDKYQAPIAAMLGHAVAAAHLADDLAHGDDETSTGDGELTLAELGRELCAMLTLRLVDEDNPILSYRWAFEWILAPHFDDAEEGRIDLDLAEEFPSSKDPQNFLRLRLLDHAMDRYFGEAAWTRSDRTRMYKAARTLGAAGTWWLIHGLIASAHKDISGSPCSYVISVAHKKKAEYTRASRA